MKPRITSLLSPLAEFDPALGWVALIRAIGALGFALSMPFLALYLHEELSVSMTQIGMMLAAAGLIGAASSGVGGAASDRYGRRRLLSIFLSLRAVTFIGLTFLVWHRLPFPLFAAVYIASSLLGTAVHPLMDAIVSDLTPRKLRNRAYGTLRVAANLGWAIGPALGGLVVTAGYHLVFLATAIMVTIATAVARLKLRETTTPVARGDERGFDLKAIAADPHLLRFLAICLIIFLVKGQLVATTSVHASANVGLTKSQIGMIYFLNGAMVALLQIPVTRLIGSRNPLRSLTAAGLLYAVGYYLVGIARSMGGMVTAIAVVTVAEMIEAPTAVAYASSLAPEGRTGLYMGTFGLITHLGWTVGPLLGGILLDSMATPQGAWMVISLLAAASAAGFLLLGKWLKRSERRI